MDDVRATLLVAGFIREGDPAFEPALLPNIIDQLHHHFIHAELARRGEPERQVGQALVVLTPDQTPTVTIDDEVDYLASIGEPSEFGDPAESFVGHVTDLWPSGVDPDSAWAGFTTAQGGRILVCDFRRNREHVRTLLVGAREFLESAKESLAAARLRPAVDSLFSAAELAVMTLIQLQAYDDGKDHKLRKKWLRGEARFGELSSDHAEAFALLCDERNAARYGDRKLNVDLTKAQALVTTVAELIDVADARRE